MRKMLAYSPSVSASTKKANFFPLEPYIRQQDTYGLLHYKASVPSTTKQSVIAVSGNLSLRHFHILNIFKQTST